MQPPVSKPASILASTAAMAVTNRTIINMPHDVHPHPSDFAGTAAEDPESWLNFLQRYCKCKRMTDEMFTENFGLYLKHMALQWYESLSDTDKTSKARLIDAFKRRFYLSDIEKLRVMSDLFRRQQQPEESVDEYFSQMQKSARILGNVPDEQLENAILLGLKPELKKHAIQVSPTSLQDLLRAAKVAESAERAAGPSSIDISKTLKRIELTLMEGAARPRSVTPIGDLDKEDRAKQRSASANQENEGRSQQRTALRDSSPYRSPPSRSYGDRQPQVRFDASADRSGSYDDDATGYQPHQQRYGTQTDRQPSRNTADDSYYRNDYGGAANTYNQRGRSFERSGRNYNGRSRNNRRGMQSRSSGDFDNRTCYNCGVQGHISRFCPP